MVRSMMMTQSYYGSGEYDPYHRELSHRSMPTAGFYGRPAPYGYYDQPRQELRLYHGGRPVTRAMVHDPDPEPAGGSRRRIAVAVGCHP